MKLDKRTAAVLALGEACLAAYREHDDVRAQRGAPAIWFAVESGNGWEDQTHIPSKVARAALAADAEVQS